MRKLIVTLIVLAALLVALDRVLVNAAETVVARRVQVTAGVDNRPEVRVHGFPFLTQAVAGEYDRIDVSLDRIERDDITLMNVRARVRDVRAPLADMLRRDGSTPVRAESARVSALVPYGVVRERIPDEVKVRRQGGGLEMAGTVTVLGRELEATAQVEVAVRDGRILFTPQDVKLEGGSVPAALAQRFTFKVGLGKLPFGLSLTGVSVEDEGVRVYAVAKDLLLSGESLAAAARHPSSCESLACEGGRKVRNAPAWSPHGHGSM